MEVKVNVINEMLKLRNSTYSDKMSWVDELVQNCQRSGASHIKVTVAYDKVIVEDNGVGCTDPQVLFDKSSSGWDSETKTTQNPFGEGFFSTMMIADMIKVSSVGFDAEFDVKNMFETGNVDCVKIKKSTRKKGFVVVLTELNDDFSKWRVVHRFREVGKYIQKPTMSINGERVPYEGLHPSSDSPFIRRVNTEWFSGWIQPFSWGRDGYDDKLKSFAFSRFVKDIPNYGIKGVLNFKDGMIGLRSPDRREFIQDGRYDDMLESLTKEIKKMLIGVLKTGTDEDIADYSSILDRHLEVKDYSKLIRFKLFNKENFVESVGEEFFPEPPVLAMKPVEVQTPDDVSGVDIHSESGLSKASTPVTSTSKQTGSSIDDIEFGMYLDQNSIQVYQDELQLASLYKIPVVIVRNCLEEKVIAEKSNFSHISNMSSLVKLKVDVTEIEAKNGAERRALAVLAGISHSIAERVDMFHIADVEASRVLVLNDTENLVENVESFALARGGDIYINRKYMAGYDGLVDDDSPLSELDKRFVLLNIDTIAHEMSHVLFDTVDNTKEHFEKIGILVQQIINAMYQEEV